MIIADRIDDFDFHTLKVLCAETAEVNVSRVDGFEFGNGLADGKNSVADPA